MTNNTKELLARLLELTGDLVFGRTDLDNELYGEIFKIRQCTERLRDHVASMGEGWRSDMENAPRNGTRILLARIWQDQDNELGEISKIVTCGQWLEEQPDGADIMGHDAGFIDIDSNDFFPGRSFGNPDYFSEGSQPTHWQYMPQPPENL